MGGRKVTSNALVQPTSHDEGGWGENVSAFAQFGGECVDVALQGRVAHRERVDVGLQGRVAHRERVDVALPGHVAHRKFQTLVDFGTVAVSVAPVTSQ